MLSLETVLMLAALLVTLLVLVFWPLAFFPLIGWISVLLWLLWITAAFSLLARPTP